MAGASFNGAPEEWAEAGVGSLHTRACLGDTALSSPFSAFAVQSFFSPLCNSLRRAQCTHAVLLEPGRAGRQKHRSASIQFPLLAL